MRKVLIYLHGFLSSPQSVKCLATQAHFEQHHRDIEFISTQIPYYPGEAITHLRKLVSQYQDCRLGYIGSSLGGFLSTNLMQDFPGKAVLINPAVTPHILLKDYLGEHIHPYTQEKFTLTEQHMAELSELFVEKMRSPENFWVLLQEKDETLDYREAVAKYQQSKLTVEPGGDHSFQGYENYLPEIVSFLFDS